MRVLHVVKTSDGAQWAARQASILSSLGVDVHVALPSAAGRAVESWRSAGAEIHTVDLNLSIGELRGIRSLLRTARNLVDRVAPDLIHSHFVSTTLTLRLALGRDHPIPRVFQVPGPLHLEHWHTRWAEIITAGKCDYWVASSEYTRRLYSHYHIPPERLFLSYYGTVLEPVRVLPPLEFRSRFGIPAGCSVVGNINFMYPPKRMLGHFVGIKGHEDVIDALGLLCARRGGIVGLLIGGEWGGGRAYEQRLRARGARAAGRRIIFPGRIPEATASSLWPNFTCAVHVPISENCGGVVEPLYAGIPTIASSVGGLPEVVQNGLTGWTVPPHRPHAVADAIEEILDDPEEACRRAERGRRLVERMFDVTRTGAEVTAIYRYILDGGRPAPSRFDSIAAAQKISAEECVSTAPGHGIKLD
jgi:glycosyltransferase involved in cell wall biosynthesis